MDLAQFTGVDTAAQMSARCIDGDTCILQRHLRINADSEQLSLPANRYLYRQYFAPLGCNSRYSPLGVGQSDNCVG
jgi:hypothetical protein